MPGRFLWNCMSDPGQWMELVPSMHHFQDMVLDSETLTLAPLAWAPDNFQARKVRVLFGKAFWKLICMAFPTTTVLKLGLRVTQLREKESAQPSRSGSQWPSVRRSCAKLPCPQLRNSGSPGRKPPVADRNHPKYSWKMDTFKHQ